MVRTFDDNSTTPSSMDDVVDCGPALSGLGPLSYLVRRILGSWRTFDPQGELALGIRRPDLDRASFLRRGVMGAIVLFIALRLG